MRKPIKKYEKPLALGVILVLTSGAWALEQPSRWQEQHNMETSRHAQSLVKGLVVLIDQLDSTAEQDKTLATLVQDRLVLEGPIRFAQLRRNNVPLVHQGEDTQHPLEEGFDETGQLLITRYVLPDEATCDHINTMHDEPPSPWSWCTTSLDKGKPFILWVGTSTQMPPPIYASKLSDLWLLLTLIWSSTSLLMWAWARNIRSRELRAALAAEQHKLERLEEQNLAAAGLAHETKNPLGLILGLAQRLADDDSADDKSRDVAEQIMDEVDRATARLSDFLNFAGLRRPNLKEARVQKVCAPVVDALRGDFDAHTVTLNASLDDGLIICDINMLEQVLVNLLLNSLHASSAGSTTSVVFDSTSGILRVRDEGVGIDEETIAHIFKPYFTGRPDGHGLGLSVVRKIVEQHGWNISVKSALGEGTTFEIRGIHVLRSAS